MKPVTMTTVFTIILTFALLLACPTRAEESTVAPYSRDAWLWKTILDLRAFRPTADHPIIEGAIRPDGSGMTYDIVGNTGKGLIRIGAPDWVYIVTHSTHLIDSIGDISLAITAAGELYQNEGHVCGRIYFASNEQHPPRTSADFFKSFTASTKGDAWKNVETEINNEEP